MSLTNEWYQAKRGRFDSKRGRFEKIGAVVSALVIASLAKESEQRVAEEFPLTDQTLVEHADAIVRRAKRWKYGPEVSAFLRRMKALEDEWRGSLSSDRNI
jgi:hypothetical protein